jgi:hypothetical protein
MGSYDKDLPVPGSVPNQFPVGTGGTDTKHGWIVKTGQEDQHLVRQTPGQHLMN